MGYIIRHVAGGCYTTTSYHDTPLQGIGSDDDAAIRALYVAVIDDLFPHAPALGALFAGLILDDPDGTLELLESMTLLADRIIRAPSPEAAAAAFLTTFRRLAAERAREHQRGPPKPPTA
jgi:hypothetical protein